MKPACPQSLSRGEVPSHLPSTRRCSHSTRNCSASSDSMGSAFEPAGSWPFVCFLTTSFPSAKDRRSLLAHTSPPADLSSLSYSFSLGNAHRLSRRARTSLFSASAAAHTAARGCGSWHAAFAQGRRSAVWLKPAATRNAAWSNIESACARSSRTPLGPCKLRVALASVSTCKFELAFWDKRNRMASPFSRQNHKPT